MPISDRAARLAYSKAYYRKNRERLLAEQKARDQAQSDPHARDAYMAKYREENKATLAAKQKLRNQAHYTSNKAKYRQKNKAQSLKRYGLTEEALAAILERQGQQCPICERFLAFPTVRAIDHCHVTGSVRGVLCRRCNTALGLLEESPANLERALEYLSMSRLKDFISWLSGVTSTPSKKP